MFKSALVLLAAVAIANGTLIQDYEGTLQGQWYDYCTSRHYVDTTSTIDITSDGDTLTIVTANWHSDLTLTCTPNTYAQALSDIDEEVTLEYLGSDTDQIVEYNCTYTYNSDDDYETWLVLNGIGGVMIYIIEDSGCSVFFSERKIYHYSDLSVEGPASYSTCTDFMFNGNTKIYNATNPDPTYNSGTILIYTDTLNGTNLASDMSEVTLTCSASYYEENPSFMVYVTYCASGTDTDVLDFFYVSFLDDGSAYILQNSGYADACVQSISGQGLLLVSLASIIASIVFAIIG
jgi:hypothetical protein